MPSNTAFKPVNRNDFTADKLNFNGQGVQGSAAANTTTNIDYTLTDDNLLQGVQLYAKTAVFGDTVTLQVLDTANGTFTGTPNALLNQFATNWGLRDDAQIQLDKTLEYPAKILTGMVVRCVYRSTGTLSAVKVLINYDLHKVLV